MVLSRILNEGRGEGKMCSGESQGGEGWVKIDSGCAGRIDRRV